MPDWGNSHRLSERLASLGIMGAQLRAPLKPPNTTVLRWSWEVSGGLQIGPQWCREAPVSRRIIRLSGVFFPVWLDVITNAEGVVRNKFIFKYSIAELMLINVIRFLFSSKSTGFKYIYILYVYNQYFYY